MNTPYYIIRKRILDEGIEKLKAALNKHWSYSVIGYSFKTNALPWIIEYMRHNGCYAEVVSEDEYELAEYMGYEHIIYNGPVKGIESFTRACQKGHIVNLDAEREVEWLQHMNLINMKEPVKVGIRINFDLEAVCPGEASGGEEGGRFGFSYENGDFGRILDKLRAMPGVEVAGIHLHCSSKTRSLNIYEAIAKMACRIHKEYKIELTYLDVGGGYFGGLADKPQYEDYLCLMAGILKEEYDPKRTMLIMEPGTSLICPPVEYVTSVIDVKDTNRNRFIVTDGSRIHIDPLMTKKSYFYQLEKTDNDDEREFLEKQVISGFTCMENDRLFNLKGSYALRVGDKIRYYKIGAYTMCLSPLFISYFPAVYLEEEGKIVCIREKWGVEEYVQKSKIKRKNV